ncbi:MAG: glycoside hydrolase family 2 protein [Candidatus Dormibacteria bacterium]
MTPVAQRASRRATPALNDCLSLTHRQGTRRIELTDEWVSTWARLGEGEERGYHLAPRPGGRWYPAEVPRLYEAVAGRESLWYRVEFRNPHFDRRTLLRFEGALLSANVWLNGRLLGSHYGYFAPFSFDISSFLRERNVLAVCVEAPVETDLSAKKHVMGLFNDWDCKPYPNNAFFSLPEPYEWHVPIGFWRPVALEQVGHVVLDHLSYTPVIEGPTSVRVDVSGRLRNLDARKQSARLRLQVSPHNFEGGSQPVSTIRNLEMEPGAVEDLAFSFNVPEPRLWWPWTHGEPNLYSALARVQVGEALSSAVDDLIGLREVRARIGRGAWAWEVNGRPMFMRGANYTPEFFLDQAIPEVLEADLELARGANMDMLRVHAHVAPEELYRAADRRGILLFCDFPLIFSYAHGANERDRRFVRQAVLSQVPEMVRLLHNRPSAALWCVHNEPPWPERLSWFGDAHTAQTNRELDEEAQALFHTLDPSRPAIAASGDLDEHIYCGWYHGHWRDFALETPGFVTEYGAQALPSRESPFWETVSTAWPVDPEDPSWRYADYQPLQWQQHGPGAPGDHPDLDSYIKAGQVYQAWLCRFATDRFRLLKGRPTGGCLVFQLVDCHDAISWSLLDYHRVPKLAYHEMALALQPTQVIIEAAGGWEPAHIAGISYEPGAEVHLRFHVVNDDPRVSGPARLEWTVHCVLPDPEGLVARTRHLLSARGGHGDVVTRVPGYDDGANLAATFRRTFRRPGEYRVEARLVQGATELARRTLPFRVGAAPAPAGEKVTNVPGFMVNRVYRRGSLQTGADWFSLSLENRLQPFAIESVSRMAVDGAEIPLAQIEVDSGSGPVSLPERLAAGPLDAPVKSELAFRVSGVSLPPGDHEFEFSLTVVGFGTVRLRVRDTLV